MAKLTTLHAWLQHTYLVKIVQWQEHLIQAWKLTLFRVNQACLVHSAYHQINDTSTINYHDKWTCTVEYECDRSRLISHFSSLFPSIGGWWTGVRKQLVFMHHPVGLHLVPMRSFSHVKHKSGLYTNSPIAACYRLLYSDRRPITTRGHLVHCGSRVSAEQVPAQPPCRALPALSILHMNIHSSGYTRHVEIATSPSTNPRRGPCLEIIGRVQSDFKNAS